MAENIKQKPNGWKVFLKIILIISITLYGLNILSSKVLGISLITLVANNRFGYFLIYPFDKYYCESKGGSYYKCISNDFDLPGACGCQMPGEIVPLKPVVYLYPTKTTDVSVKINYLPGFSVSYPEYKNGWMVTANSDGKIINKTDGLEYSYLYWEGNPDSNAKYDLSTGFVVKGSDTASFLQTKLAEIGLTPKEYNEFIVYWLPQMKFNTYNLIHFATKSEYSDRVKMDITPQPDSILRVMMTYKPIDKYISIKPQSFSLFVRQGFYVVEWGGSKLD